MTTKMRYSASASACVLGGLVALALVPSAFAQTASQVTRESYAPPVIRQADGGGLSLPSVSGLETPKGAEALHVTPSGLVVEGGMPELAGETAAIEARLAGKRVTGADLFAAARDLEAAYARAGYLLARVSLPPQTIRDGLPLKLVVTVGYVAAVDASALPGPARKRIEAVMAPLVGKKDLTRRELERRLLLAGDTPGVSLKSTLKAGEAPGSTVIVVDGRHDRVTGDISVDNGLGESLSNYAFSAGLNLNNALGFGEVFYGRVGGDPGLDDRSIFSNDPRNGQFVVGFTVPLGTDGYWLNMEGVDSRTHPSSDLGYTMRDHFQRLSTRFGYSWLRSRDANTATVLSFDVAEESQKIDFRGSLSDFTKDSLRVLRLTQTGDLFSSFGGQFSGSVTASFGLDAFGARSGTSTVPLSRTGAQPDFAKLEASGSYNQPFHDNRLLFSLSAKAQTSFGEPLVSSEQTGLGGLDWVSAFDSGDYQGDAAAVVRGEIAFPYAFSPFRSNPKLDALASPYVFAAAGLSHLERPSAVEDAISRAAAFGAGLRLSFSEQASPLGASLTLEYAHGTATGNDSEDRFNLRFLARF